MLMDMLGVLVGFATAMLLMSLIVTMLVQVVQDILRLRGRALRKSIADLWDSLPAAKFEGSNNADEKKPLIDTRKFQKTSSILNEKIGRAAFQNSFFEWLFGPPVSEISQEEFVTEASSADTSDDDKKLLARKFLRMEENSSRRFRIMIKLLTGMIAIIVAGYFQVSAPELLHSLSVNPELRAKFGKEAENTLELYKAGVSTPLSYEEISSQALDKLVVNYPEAAETLEEVSAIDIEKADLLYEMKSVLEANDIANRTTIIDAYENNMETLLTDRTSALRKINASTINQLGVLGITPWAYGWGHYKEVRNIIGVLITALLLSLGAPFWFEQLKNLAKLRDTFADRRKGAGA